MHNALKLSVASGCTQTSNSNLIAASKEENPFVRLFNSNERFSPSKTTHPQEDLRRLKELSEDQHPFAVVVCCSGSRVSPEIIFDQGRGDLFPASDKNRLDDCVTANVLHGAKQLHTQSNILVEKIDKNELKIRGVQYDLDDFKIVAF